MAHGRFSAHRRRAHERCKNRQSKPLPSLAMTEPGPGGAGGGGVLGRHVFLARFPAGWLALFQSVVVV